jgi:hypothetical protein
LPLERDGPADAPEPRPVKIDFTRVFLNSEDNEEERSSLTTVLDTLHQKWPDGAPFQASDVVTKIFRTGSFGSFGIDVSEARAEAAAGFKAALELACGKLIPIVSAPVINWRLSWLPKTRQ